MPWFRSRPNVGRLGALSGHEIAHELLWLVLIVACAAVLQNAGLLYPIERFLIDVFAATDPTSPSTSTVIIDIDEESFEGPYFDRERPIKPDAIAGLIRAAARAGARVIVVDVDTDVSAVRAALGEPRPTLPIVWAAVTQPCGPEISPVRLFRAGKVCVTATDPLSSMPGRPAEWAAGLTALIHDGDDVLRRYRREFETGREGSDGACECSEGLKPTLSRAAAVAYDPKLQHLELDEGEPLLLNWRADRWFSPRFKASQVLLDYKNDWWIRAAQPMYGKIALIGGTFAAGRDVHRTPAGEMTGVEVLAHIVESELAGRGMAPFKERYAILIDFAVGLALTIVNLLLPSVTRRGLLLNALMVFVLPLATSWQMYRLSMYWTSLAPVAAGVFIHQWHRRSSRLVPVAEPVH